MTPPNSPLTPDVHLVDRPAFQIWGRKTWISGQDNALFARFWELCRADGLLDDFQRLRGNFLGAVTGSFLLGVSCVEEDPAVRTFDYWIAIEAPTGEVPGGLSARQVPACTWAVFACRGPVPHALVAAEMYAFREWLPVSGFIHAQAPEMEVYPPDDNRGGESYCEFWLPVARTGGG